jgi:histidinol-phosphate phosphatase family protein
VLACLGLPIVVVTNQASVGRGLVLQATVDDIHLRMTKALRENGVELAGVYLCPHAPDQGCDCRKPKPGLFFRAATELTLDLQTSWMIGDNLRDIEAAEAAGVVNRILVLTGHGRTFEDEVTRSARAQVATDLLEAAGRIGRAMERRQRG